MLIAFLGDVIGDRRGRRHAVVRPHEPAVVNAAEGGVQQC